MMNAFVHRLVVHDKQRKPEIGFIACEFARKARRRSREFPLNG
jgi:hypothetical protein